MIAAGRGAFTSLRLEKGYRSFGTDMTYEHDPYEAGLGFAVKLDKGDFLGRAALQQRRDGRRPGRQLTCLTIDGPGGRRRDGQGAGLRTATRCVGYVTSAAYGYTIGTGIAYAWLPAALAEPGHHRAHRLLRPAHPTTVGAGPLFDPEMTRLRG